MEEGTAPAERVKGVAEEMAQATAVAAQDPAGRGEAARGEGWRGEGAWAAAEAEAGAREAARVDRVAAVERTGDWAPRVAASLEAEG